MNILQALLAYKLTQSAVRTGQMQAWREQKKQEAADAYIQACLDKANAVMKQSQDAQKRIKAREQQRLAEEEARVPKRLAKLKRKELAHQKARQSIDAQAYYGEAVDAAALVSWGLKPWLHLGDLMQANIQLMQGQQGLYVLRDPHTGQVQRLGLNSEHRDLYRTLVSVREQYQTAAKPPQTSAPQDLYARLAAQPKSAPKFVLQILLVGPHYASDPNRQRSKAALHNEDTVRALRGEGPVLPSDAYAIQAEIFLVTRTLYVHFADLWEQDNWQPAFVASMDIPA
ncbi:hypothetical protein SAMN05421831_11142 [Allopseudospirillum japonicum]|uniref:Uncharacterized protein n=1 Tax=Allopseudospirillum japonicum TaxID=64971 RepID=A0A1H6TPQ4_9GAMM|nr:hypothetical protein [Allopseudospirillum japonicum]SEI82033.1 hypothetical protein SAMN05421831_11142 [Allopseudospirillum japonicum]